MTFVHAGAAASQAIRRLKPVFPTFLSLPEDRRLQLVASELEAIAAEVEAIVQDRRCDCYGVRPADAFLLRDTAAWARFWVDDREWKKDPTNAKAVAVADRLAKANKDLPPAIKRKLEMRPAHPEGTPPTTGPADAPPLPNQARFVDWETWCGQFIVSRYSKQKTK